MTALFKPDSGMSQDLFRCIGGGAMLLVALTLGACSKPVARTDDIRPVRAIRLTPEHAGAVAEFPGEVRPRIESRLGFRVAGKIVAREVEIGSAVKRGQTLMRLDPQDLQLAQTQASAALKAAESNRDLAKAEFARYQELRDRNFVSQAVLDAKQAAFKAAQASYEQAFAALRNQSNQANYTTLVADADGVVTGIDAEVGQVVAAGTPVVRVARAGGQEVVIGIPEGDVDVLRQVRDVRVKLWARPDAQLPGIVREVSPVADPATRTYAVKVALPAKADGVKLGMTATVAFISRSADAALRVPLTALFSRNGQSAVWVVDHGAVQPALVRVAGTSGNDALLAGGVSAGQTVVTAGAHLLRPGQKVTVLDPETSLSGTASDQRNDAPLSGFPVAANGAVK